uniref:Uncharacterized protein n=1 Tax=Picea sitchensis TaxID=3332 RepID=A9NKY5_PICSI|nr:unknown [Picea sitchensis]
MKSLPLLAYPTHNLPSAVLQPSVSSFTSVKFTSISLLSVTKPSKSNGFHRHPTRALNDEQQQQTPPEGPSPSRLESLEVRAGLGRRARRKRDRVSDPNQVPVPKKKDWESMTLQEKAVEVYMGEKGILFWLNKSAYASIFILIGAWVLFRFVGPLLGLYQLESNLLEPTKAFGGL